MSSGPDDRPVTDGFPKPVTSPLALVAASVAQWAGAAARPRIAPVKVQFFHLMPYGPLDMSFREHYNSVWLRLPNS